MIGRILFWFCSISTFLVMLLMTLFIRNLPKLMRLFLELIRNLLYLSYLVYQALLVWIHNQTRNETGIHLLTNPSRTVACILVSLTFYMFISVIFDNPLSIWIAGCWALHGFLIGYLWKEFFDPDGLNMGESLW